MLEVCDASLKILDDVDPVRLSKTYRDVVNQVSKFFKTVQLGLVKTLHFNEEDFDDMESVMKFAGGRGKSALERMADAINCCECIQDWNVS